MSMKRPWKGEGHPPRPLVVTDTEAIRITSGRKTQLRRLARRERLTGGLKASGMKPGATYEIQTAIDEPPTARIVITDVHDQALVDITDQDAAAEGHQTRAEFADAWMLRHDRHWPILEERECPHCRGHGVVNDERCAGGCDDIGIVMVRADLEPDEILKIFTARHRERWVWVVTFELAQHLYLHRKTDGGYTADPREALLDAGEVLDPPRPDWAERAERRRREDLQAEHGARLARPFKSDYERLQELKAIAAELGVDIRSDVDAVDSHARRRMAVIERKIRDRTEGRAA